MGERRMKMLLKASVALLALATLSACGDSGGSGVASTPTPPSPPAPPSPPPPPPPTPPNTSLLNLTSSESFVNDAVTSAATFDTTGQIPKNISASPATAIIAYDLQSKNYSITVSGRSQTFTPASADAINTSAQIASFKVVAGTTTDILTITKPGTSGAYTYQYVGGGFWQRSVQTGTSIVGTLDAFTYGIPTLTTGVPRTGNAAYNFDALGTLVVPNGSPAPYSLGGSGRFLIDFSTGDLTGTGAFKEIDTNTNTQTAFNEPWIGSAKLSATSNSFLGTSQYNRFGIPFVGSLTGRFYGPAGEEIGAAIYGTSSSGGAFAAALIGRKDPNGAGINLSLTGLSANQNFVTRSTFIQYEVNPQTGQMVRVVYANDPLQFSGGGGANAQFSYTQSPQSYSISDPHLGQMPVPTGTYGTGQIAPTQSDARFTEYSTTNGTTATSLRLYKTGAANSEIALSYASFGIWDQTQKPNTAGNNFTDTTYFTYGINSTSIPVGSATYNGFLHGVANSTQAGSDIYSLTGSFQFLANFTANTLTGSLTANGINQRTSATQSFGTYTLSQGQSQSITAGPIGFGAYLDAGANTSIGYVKGSYYGPLAKEIGGVFMIKQPDTQNAGQFIYLNGAIVGSR
jgi:hypothetical protein